MLVLSRKNGERIQIGDDITVEVRRVAGNRVTLAIAAPREKRILRGELEAAAKAFGSSSDTTDTSDDESDTREELSVTIEASPETIASFQVA